MDKNNKSKKPWFKRFWVWVGIIILVGIIASALSPKEMPKLADDSGSVDSSSADKKSEQTVFKPGDTIEFDKKKVIVAVPERKWDSGNQFIQPENGNEFVKVQVTIENNSDSEAMYNSFDWKLQDSKGVIKDVDGSIFTIDGALDSGQLAPKGTVSGFLVFQVPADDVGLTLRYSPSFWSEKKVEVKF